MKNIPKLKIAPLCLFICGTMLFIKCKPGNNKGDVNDFLTQFNRHIQNTQTDSLVHDFDMPQRKGAITQLISLLCNKSGVAKNSKPVFRVELNTQGNDLKEESKDITKVTFSLKLIRDNLDGKISTLLFKVKRGTGGAFKIVDVDASLFLSDYVDYENWVRQKTLTDKDIYSPQTLAAFKTAIALKANYDSIPWFQHMGDKTYYVVIKGKLNNDEVYKNEQEATYKMGLVDADKKEIIPPLFDLIHNIGATFPNLIETEKDHLKGFYNLDGQCILPVTYNQIFPLNDGGNLAVLREGNDYYWWKKDYTVSDKDPDIKIADLLPKIQAYGKSARLTETILKNVTEYNSRDEHGSIYIAPSYMADWGLMPAMQIFKNPLRKNVEYEGVSELYELTFEGETSEGNWLSSAFYSIRDNYLGGRSGLYAHKNVLVINKKNNRIYSHDISSYLSEEESADILNGKCNISRLKAINDSVYEVVIGAQAYKQQYDDKIIGGGPEYHYLQLKDDKLVELPVNRLFGFTKYVQMDDSYLKGCYVFLDQKTGTNVVTPEMLRYMKNEIYADYLYQFKDKKWAEVFGQNPEYDKLNATVDDSLTTIDKYNIAFINKKLQELNKNKALAAR